VDEVNILINIIRQYDQRADDLEGFLGQARAATSSQQWQEATNKFRSVYRDIVKEQLSKFVPEPILALPGVRDLMLQLVDRTLEQGERAVSDAAREIMLGPATASLNLQAVMLKPPPHLATLRPALIGFKPPQGLALNFDSGPASGGGALDYQRTPGQRLSGALGLKIGIVQVSALSILQEESSTYSLMTLLAGRFAPGIQLGFGFAITGMGGLIGLNRAADPAALEAHFRSGAFVNALFGDDPIGKAMTTVNTLGAVFRLRMGSHVFGPSMQLSWLKAGTFTLFNIDFGVFMQLPGPSRIDIIGSARAGIPLIFQLRLDVRGELDFARRMVSIHAVIVDSYMMGVFKMQGEAIFRMRYGDDPYVVLTIGGFFPGFNPAPAELPPHIQRIGMALDLPVKLPVYLRVAGYLAVTPNTLQFGAHMEAGFDAGFFSAEGHFILDALFQFDPFRFEIRFSAGFHIKILGESFSGVECAGTITGPGPLVIHARITYRTPFYLPNIKWSDTFNIGRPAPAIAGSADLYEPMKRELNPANLRAENADDPHVMLNLKRSQEGQFALLAPRGDLVWSQRLAPLNLQLDRLQNTPLLAPNGVSVTTDGQDPNGPRERFNLGMYLNLTDAERMNLNARVEDHLCGVRKRFGMGSGPEANLTITFVEFIRPELIPLDSPIFKLLSGPLLQKVSGRSAVAQVANLNPRVSTVRESWRAAGQGFDSQAAAHVNAKKTGSVAHLASIKDTVNLEGV
jgi:hypothetical protein